MILLSSNISHFYSLFSLLVFDLKSFEHCLMQKHKVSNTFPPQFSLVNRFWRYILDREVLIKLSFVALTYRKSMLILCRCPWLSSWYNRVLQKTPCGLHCQITFWAQSLIFLNIVHFKSQQERFLYPRFAFWKLLILCVFCWGFYWTWCLQRLLVYQDFFEDNGEQIGSKSFLCRRGKHCVICYNVYLVVHIHIRMTRPSYDMIHIFSYIFVFAGTRCRWSYMRIQFSG